jgi:F-type H+-transporting ATPase subunit epsilon
MADTIVLEVATPERRLVHEPVMEAQIPAATGFLGILPGHAPLLAQLGIGEMAYKTKDGKSHVANVAGGYVEVSGGHVRVLADAAEVPNEIDLTRAEAALKRANDRLSKIDGVVDVARAINAMKRAQSRLELAKKYGIIVKQ